MITVAEVKDWLKGMNDSDELAIDDGGLAMVLLESGKEYEPDHQFENYIEIGGVPLVDAESEA